MIIFVGDKPSPGMKSGTQAFEGARCEARLRSWLKELVYYQHNFIIVNQYDLATVPGPFAPGIKWVALGNVASKRLNSLGLKHFKLPHPSGRNGKLNDKNYVAEQLRLCKEWLQEET